MSERQGANGQPYTGPKPVEEKKVEEKVESKKAK